MGLSLIPSNVTFAVKPRIVREGLQMISTIKVGRNHTFDVEVIGEPITTKMWFKGEATVELENDEKVSIENEDYETKITFTKAQRRVSVLICLFPFFLSFPFHVCFPFEGHRQVQDQGGE